MKKLLKIIGVLVALLVVIALAAPLFISADFLKAQLTEQVKKTTGRTLSIKGDASVKLFPNIAVKVEDVTLGNPEGFKAPYLVHIARLETGAALGPLLNKQLRVTGITLAGATIHLEETASGAKNWEFVAKNTAETVKETAETTKAAEKSSALNQFALGTVRISDTAINYTKSGAKPIALNEINVDIDGADGASPLKLKGGARYQGEKISVALNVKDLKKFLEGVLVSTSLEASLPQTTVKFSGNAGAKGALYGAEGKLDATIADVAKLQSWATGKPAKPAFPRSVALTSGIKASGVNNTLALSDLNAKLDSLAASGSLSIAHGGAVPSLTGALTIPTLDLDAIASGAKPAANTSAGQASSAPAGKSDGWSDAPIDASALRAANANLKLTIANLKSGNVAVSDIVTDIALNGGKLKLGLGNASLYGGKASGTVNLDGSGTGLGLGTNLTLAGIDIDALMTALSGASKLKGIATIGLNVSGAGISQHAIVSSLGGNAKLRISDGAIKGINIASFLRDAKQGFILGNSTSESTDFTELTASFPISKGIVSNEDLLMKSPILRLTGKGTVNLPARTINYRALPEIVGSLKGQGGKDKLGSGLAVPLIITGPWSAISITPDVAGMVNEAIKNPEALKENLKGIKDTLGDYNSPKDIGKALLGGGKKETAPTPVAGEAAPAPSATTPAPEAAKTKEQKIEEGIGGLLNTLGKQKQ